MVPATALNVGAIAALPEDWKRALCVAAHPDDLEYGVASAVAPWTAQHKHVIYLPGAAFDPAGFLTWHATAAGERMGVDAAVLLDVFTLIPARLPPWTAGRRGNR
jgi:hypothetical protein